MAIFVLLVLALFVIQTLIPGRLREPAGPGEPSSLKQRLGNRDQIRPFTVTGQRAARALANLQEAMPVFLGLALLDMLLVPEAPLAKTGALVFLIARAVYLAIYLAGIPVVRSLVFAASWVGLALMMVPILEHL
jgi:uncharacterized MAPEG superfamily protein